MPVHNDTGALPEVQETIAQIMELMAGRMAIRIDSPDTDLLGTGILDSLALVRLMSVLGERFGLDSSKLMLDLGSFHSVETIAAMVVRLRPKPEAAPEKPGPGDDFPGSEAQTEGGPSLADEIRSVLLDSLSVRVDSLDADLFRVGVLDSMALVRFILALEERFGVEIPIDEIDVAAFRSIADIAKLLAGYLNRHGSGAVGGAGGNGL